MNPDATNISEGVSLRKSANTYYMERFLKTLMIPLACLAAGSCQIFVRSVDAPTYMEIDGKGFTSKVEEVSWRYTTPGTIDIEGEQSFFYGYERHIHSSDKTVYLVLTTAHSEGLEIGKKYTIGRSENENWQLVIPAVEYDGKLYYATDGWIVFHDIEVYAPDAYLSGSFEFNASTEDTSDTIHISNGTFERVPSNYIYHKEGDKPWYKKYL